MSRRMVRRGVLAVVALVALAGDASAQTWVPFYTEVIKDGRIYVFALGERYEMFQKSGGSEIGPAITRPGYGPNGETVVFDSEDAINLYNFKHNLPGEYFPKPEETPKSPYPSGKIIGLAFGDFYYFANHNDDSIKHQSGFWLRRAYLGWDQSFSPRVSARLRLEMNSNGRFAGGNLTPYVKDAYLTWKYKGDQQARIGIQPSLTFDSEEGFWGLRHIEKTPADLYRIDFSRDFGLTLGGPVGEGGLSYAVQVGNDSGNGSETDRYKIVRFLGLFEAKSGLRVEGVFNFARRADDEDRTTAKGELGYKGRGLPPRRRVPVAEARVRTGRRSRHQDRHLVGLRGLELRSDEGERLRPLRQGQGQARKDGDRPPGGGRNRLPRPQHRVSLQDLDLRARVVPPRLGPPQPQCRVD